MISFKPLTESDFPLLYIWFQKPHVKLWYARGEDYTLEMITEKYRPRISNQSIPNFIIYEGDKPIGYIQLYHVSRDALPDGIDSYEHLLFASISPDQMAGIDLFIADENYLRNGYATAVLKQFINEHVVGKFAVIVSDPLKINVRAIQFFARNGFKKFAHNTENSPNELMLLHVDGEL